MDPKTPAEIVNGLEAIKDLDEACDYAIKALQMPEIVPLPASGDYNDEKNFLLSACVQACEESDKSCPSSSISCNYAKEALEIPELESWPFNQFLESKVQACEAGLEETDLEDAGLQEAGPSSETGYPSAAEQNRALNKVTRTEEYGDSDVGDNVILMILWWGSI